MTAGGSGSGSGGGSGGGGDQTGKVDKRVDLAVAVGFLAFGGWLFRAAGRIPEGSVPDQVGSGGVARVLASVIVILSGYLVVRRLVTWRGRPAWIPSEGSVDDPDEPASAGRAFAVFALLGGYVLGVRYLGYPLATPVFVAAGLWVMRVRSPLKVSAVCLGYTVVTYVLFVGMFGVLLPLGVLGRWDYYLWFHL